MRLLGVSSESERCIVMASYDEIRKVVLAHPKLFDSFSAGLLKVEQQCIYFKDPRELRRPRVTKLRSRRGARRSSPCQKDGEASIVW